VALHLQKPLNLDNKIDVIQIIRLANTLEFYYFNNNQWWKFQKNEKVYLAFLSKYYGEFYYLALKNKQFGIIADKKKEKLFSKGDTTIKSIQTYSKLKQDMLDKRPHQQVLYYKKTHIILIPYLAGIEANYTIREISSY
jgi:hypothetical protein